MGRFVNEHTRKPLVLSKQWERNVGDAIRFYEIAQQRDNAISETLDKYFVAGTTDQRPATTDSLSPGERGGVREKSLKSEVSSLVSSKLTGIEPAILVYGGFHKENIKRILEARGISYVVVSPRITKPSPRHEAYYKKLMTVGSLAFERAIVPATATSPKRIFENANGPAEVRAVYDAARLNPEVDVSLLEKYLPIRPARLPVEDARSRSEMRVVFENTGEENKHNSDGEISVSEYHRLIKELFEGRDFLNQTLQHRLPGQDVASFVRSSAISVSFLASASETRIYRVSVRPDSGGDPVVFALTLGQRSRIFEDQEAARGKAQGVESYNVKQEFLNLQKMHRVLPRNVVEPYIYVESGAQGQLKFPIFSMQYAAGNDGIYVAYADGAFRLISQRGSKSMWQMVGNDFRSFLRYCFKLQIQLYLGAGEAFYTALRRGDLMYLGQAATKPAGPPYHFSSEYEFKTVPYNEKLPLILTSGRFSTKATKGFLVWTFFREEQAVNSKRQSRMEPVYFSLPYQDVAPAFYAAMSELFPGEGKERTLEWLQAYLEEYGSHEPSAVVTFVKKFIRELGGTVTSEEMPSPKTEAKTKTGDSHLFGDTQARSEVRGLKQLEALTWSDEDFPQFMEYLQGMPALVGILFRLRLFTNKAQLPDWRKSKTPFEYFASIVFPILLFGQNWRASHALERFFKLVQQKEGTGWFYHSEALQAAADAVGHKIGRAHV